MIVVKIRLLIILIVDNFEAVGGRWVKKTSEIDCCKFLIQVVSLLLRHQVEVQGLWQADATGLGSAGSLDIQFHMDMIVNSYNISHHVSHFNQCSMESRSKIRSMTIRMQYPHARVPHNLKDCID